MKIGSIVRIKSDIIGSSGEFIGQRGRVIKIEPRCEGEYVTVLLDPNSGTNSAYKDVRAFCFSVGELEEHF